MVVGVKSMTVGNYFFLCPSFFFKFLDGIAGKQLISGGGDWKGTWWGPFVLLCAPAELPRAGCPGPRDSELYLLPFP